MVGEWPIATNRPWHLTSVLGAGLEVLQARAVDVVAAEDLADRGIPDEADLRVLEGPVLHDLGGAQLGAPVHQGDLGGELGQEGRFLDRGVAAADHEDFLFALEAEAVAGVRRPRRRGLHEALLRLQAQELGVGSRRDDDGLGLGGLALAGLDMERPLRDCDLRDIFRDDLDVQALALPLHAVHELRALNGLGKAGEILDVGGDHQLAAHRDPPEDQGVQVGARRVDGGGRGRRAGADDDNLPGISHNYGKL